jgi:hypothetical protein
MKSVRHNVVTAKGTVDRNKVINKIDSLERINEDEENKLRRAYGDNLDNIE